MAYTRAYTPGHIRTLAPGEIFVFGSNLAGHHGGGAARAAQLYFGAIYGQGVGLQGQSYAIPTMHGGPETIKPYVDEFIVFAKQFPEYKFLVTPIGCGIAGFTPRDMAPLFADAIDVENILLPKSFVDVICPTVVGPEWDAEAFIAERERLRQSADFRTAMSRVKAMRAEVFANTVAIVKAGSYVAGSGVRYSFGDDKAMVEGTEFYDAEIKPMAATGAHDTIYEVKNSYCLEVAAELVRAGKRALVLNMASLWTPGGGVVNGAGAQEEELFRRTNLFRSLYQFAPFGAEYGVRRSAKQYPLDPDFGGIYTPDATLFRKGEGKGYALMDEPVRVSFVAVAAIKHPELSPDNRLTPEDKKRTLNKIRTILRIARQKSHDTLVLGALGCGAYGNPPMEIARLFKAAFEEPEFAGAFRQVVFAILDDHNAHKAHNPEGNYRPFLEVFS